jgi:hypothetical protein
LKTLGKSAFSRVFSLAQREGFEHSENVGKSRGFGFLTKKRLKYMLKTSVF